MAPAMDYVFTRGEEEIEVCVEYTAAPIYRATYDDPAHGGEIEIESVTDQVGRVALTPEEAGRLMEWLADHHEETDDREWEPEDDYNGDY